jgi:hypothetical protein
MSIHLETSIWWKLDDKLCKFYSKDIYRVNTYFYSRFKLLIQWKNSYIRPDYLVLPRIHSIPSDVPPAHFKGVNVYLHEDF